MISIINGERPENISEEQYEDLKELVGEEHG